MVLIQVDLTKKANKNLRVYMAENDLIDKRIAVNRILEQIGGEKK